MNFFLLIVAFAIILGVFVVCKITENMYYKTELLKRRVRFKKHKKEKQK